MSSSSTRLERYLTIAACGSGAVGLAVSPLHGDIHHFSSEFILSLPGGSSTQGSTSWNFTGGSVSWWVNGSRSASMSTFNRTTTWSSSFTSMRATTGYNTIYWFATGSQIGSRLFGAGELIDLSTMQDVGFSWASIHFEHSWFSNYYYFFSSSYGGTSTRQRFSSSGSSDGVISPGDRGFLALGFDLGGETVYGWADISLSSDGLSLTVHSWAFEDSGEGILAGQTENATPVPGLGGLAALACGAAGLRRKRDRVA